VSSSIEKAARHGLYGRERSRRCQRLYSTA
jgi:hypothetical protein